MFAIRELDEVFRQSRRSKKVYMIFLRLKRQLSTLSAIIALLFMAMPARCVGAADHWVEHGAVGVVTNNDCGSVSAVTGEVRLKRSFMQNDSDGISVHIADRVHAGDLFAIAAHGGVEWVTGHNTIAALGPDTRAVVAGVRAFADPDGRTVSRLDVVLEQGAARVQVRLNRERPEAVLVRCANAEALVLRGDVEVETTPEWSIRVVSGEAEARVIHSGIAGAAFTIGSGAVLTAEGMAMQQNAVAMRVVPFSYETVKAALPPRPVSGAQTDAP